jgi:DNA invertase Pin-like site-specific DNA recombinase
MAETQERIKTALYARVYNDDYESILAPLERLRTLAEENGLETVFSFYDINGGRQEFDRMMREGTGEDPPFRKILVLNQSQFARSEEGRAECTKKLEANGVQVVCFNDNLQAEEEYVDTKLATVDEFARENRSQEIKRGLRHAASKGHFVSSTVPYGYRKVTSDETARQHFTLELDPATSPIVRRIYDLWLQGSPDKDIAQELNHDRIPSPNGRRWIPLQVRRIRQNEVNCGTYIFGREDTDPIRVPSAFPAIVSPQEFDRAQVMTRNAEDPAQ